MSEREAIRRSAGFPLRLEQVGRPADAGGRPGNEADSTVPHPTAPRPARVVLRPQAPLQHAAALPRAMASGVGLDSADVRRRMVERLRKAGFRDERVLQALASVARHRFVDPALAHQAYEDTSLPIGHGQTISKPSVIARMLELLMEGAQARGSGRLGRVLEIGTGCGYQAALLAHLARSVISVERLKPLHDKARVLMAPDRGANVRLVHADGIEGHRPNAPYDSIVAAAGGDDIPRAWLEQLAVGGRLVAPIAHDETRQVLVVVDRNAAGYQRRLHEPVRFVALKSGIVR